MAGKSKTAQLEQLVETILEPSPFEVVLVEYQKAGKEWTLRVYIDHPEGVNIDHCQTASNLITDALEDQESQGDDFHIEVSSPGVDRPLYKHKDYMRFLNERVFIKTHKAVEGSKSFTGELLSCSDEAIEVCNEQDQKTVQIPFELIAKATLKPILNFS